MAIIIFPNGTYDCPSTTTTSESECTPWSGGNGSGSYSWTVPSGSSGVSNNGLNFLGLNTEETAVIGIILAAAIIFFIAGTITAPILLAVLGVTALGYLALTSLNNGYNAINNSVVQPLQNLGSNISQGLQNMGLPSSIANGFNLILVFLIVILVGYGGYLIYKNL